MGTAAGRFFTNQNLFSTNYLENRLPETGLWRDQEKETAQAFAKVKAAYQDIQELRLGPGEEVSLEERFIRPIFKALGFTWQPQPITQRGLKKKRPDYALFASEAELREARKDKTNLKRFFSHALTIAEAKYWNRPLNDAVKEDTLDPRDATAQLVKYLDDVWVATDGKILWGILTNGKLWRLFYYRAASRSGNYYEVDLEKVIFSGDADAFKYFYLFFARDAFIKDPQTGKTWLDQHLEGSETYAKVIGEKLKERIFDQVFERLAEGFLEYRSKERGITTEDESTLTDVFNGCLTLLYRLLFVLYAEARELLPVSDEHRYYRKSLRKLQLDVLDDLHRVSLDHMSRNAYDYWARLESLCRIIDKGDKALNVPTYNGGLFQSSAPDEDQSPEARAIRFVRDHKLADPYLAEAIEDLTVDDTEPVQPGQIQFIDYSSLNVRHLGDIYEGLLEFHVRIAKEEMAEVREKGRSVWKPLREVKGARTYRRKNPGEVYIENSRHERRATGSYFTRPYIVEYIVKNTVGPVLEERLKQAQDILEELEKLYQKQRRLLRKGEDWRHWEHPGEPKGSDALLIAQKEGEVFDMLFSLKVFDPAMGSGHFLVHTVDFIADRIVSFLANYPENPVIRRIEEMRRQILEDVKERQGVEIDEKKLTDVNLIKRMVMKRCIYGVDLNPMAVELSKLSLWLDSFTLGAPLSFLDHHLKCGNSLIGARDIQAHLSPGSERRNDFLRAMANLLQVAELTDATASEVEQSRQLYRDAVRWLYPTKERVNVQIAKHFIPVGNEGKVMDWAYRTELKTDDPLEKPHLENFFAVQAVAAEKRFFHWELEFPEVFFERVGETRQKLEMSQNHGFDAVIGNPPYVRIQKQEDMRDKKWLATYQTTHGSYDLYVPFTERSFSLTSLSGCFCFIMPNKFFQAEYGGKLRELVTQGTHISQIVNFAGNQIFAGSQVTTYTCLFFLSRIPQEEFLYYEVLPLSKVEEELPDILVAPGSSPKVKAGTFKPDALGIEPWCFPLGQEQAILEKARLCSEKLGNVTEQIIVGLQTSADKIYILENRGPGSKPRMIRVYSFSQEKELELETPLLKPLVSGEDIERYGTPEPHHVLLFPYELQPGGGAELIPADKFEKQYPLIWDYLKSHENQLRGRENGKMDHEKWYAYVYPKNLDKHERPKLGVPRLVDRLKVMFDPFGHYYLDNVDVNGILFPSTPSFSPLYLLGILNSRFLNFLFKKGSVRFRGTFFSANKQFIEPLPIRRINFTTMEKERTRLLEKGKKLYERCLAKGDQACVLGFVEHALKQTPEQVDVVHGLLAFLAEQMIEMNKAKQVEVRGFLGWLEREIGAKVDNLKNKTRLEDYHEGTFGGLLEVLKENHRSLTIDPSRREFQDRLEKEYNNSLTKLSPLKARIEATDRLIDQIVYKLYGLGDAEIAVVEGVSTS